ncbi:MAG: hypothetical protein LBI17_03810, partial [Rickettsiales bacterium]|nr:hypothetical protein [Rickettsiales bacterium]
AETPTNGPAGGASHSGSLANPSVATKNAENTAAKTESSTGAEADNELAAKIKELEKRLAEIPEATCEESFNICMDSICMNEHGVRYECSGSLDSFETREIDGNKIRFGQDMYVHARGTCVEDLKSCPLAERNSIETAYKAKIQEDMLMKTYIDAMTYTGEEAAADATEAYAGCMAQFCGAGFTDCLSVVAIERRASKCEPALKGIARPMAVKKAFYVKMEQLNLKLCEEGGGYVHFDDKKCRITVAFGKPATVKSGRGLAYSGKMKKKLIEKTFKLGEMVECTQSYFDTFAEDKPGFWHGVAQLGGGVVKMIAGGVMVIAGAVTTVASFGGAAEPGRQLIMGGTSLGMTGTADVIDGGLTMLDGVEVGACFIDNQMVATLNTFFRVNFPIKE